MSAAARRFLRHRCGGMAALLVAVPLRLVAMTGLDLESFLLLIRADLSTWAFLGLATLGLAFLAWSCWGSRRALRKCLVLSLAAHLGLVLYGSTVPAVMWAVNPDRRDATSRAHVREIRVAPARRVGTALREGIVGTECRYATG